MKWIKKRLNDKGQGLVEYVLIVALIAIVLVAAVKLFGTNVNKEFNTMAQEVAKWN
jgi:pilus assembly protein Flp/PilA